MRPKNISGAWCQFRKATVRFGSTSDCLDKYRRNAHVTTTQAVPGWLAIPNPGGKLMTKFHGPFMPNIISECSETRFRKPSVSRCMPGKSAQASRGEAGYRIRWIQCQRHPLLLKKAESDAGAGGLRRQSPRIPHHPAPRTRQAGRQDRNVSSEPQGRSKIVVIENRSKIVVSRDFDNVPLRRH
jgi:hypothetical protein